MGMIIGISGYTRAGKDTTGAAFVSRGWTRIAFADQIRHALEGLNPLVDGSRRLNEAVTEYGWETAKQAFPEIRFLLQHFGSEVGRERFGESFWIDMAFRDIQPGAKIIVTDCRFPNEADRIREMGGQVWRITRPGFGPGNDHASETALDDYPFDRFIANDGTISDLDIEVGRILSLGDTQQGSDAALSELQHNVMTKMKDRGFQGSLEDDLYRDRREDRSFESEDH
jgi:hypothetical protein